MQRSEQNVAAKQAINTRYIRSQLVSVDFFYQAHDLKLIFCSANIKTIKNNITVQF